MVPIGKTIIAIPKNWDLENMEDVKIDGVPVTDFTTEDLLKALSEGKTISYFDESKEMSLSPASTVTAKLIK